MKPYRGLTKDGKMVYGWYQRTDPSTPDKIKHYIIDCCGVTSTALALAHTLSDLPGYHEVIPESVGQQVGLKDKNGKDVYKIDVIKGIHKTTKEEITGEVVWDEGAFQWGIQLDSWIMNFECLVSCYDFEIIPPEVKEKSK